MPQPGRDSALVLELDRAHRWYPAAVVSLPSPAPCTYGGSGISLAVSLDSMQRSGVGPGSVVRIFETIEARRYASGGVQWLGIQSVSAGETVQPLAGPLTATGLTVGPESARGVPTALPANAEAVRLRIQGITTRELGVGMARAAVATDSLPAYVFFRNRP
jgi:hypothetical protein